MRSPTTLKPAFWIMARISPACPAVTASGLMIEKVRCTLIICFESSLRYRREDSKQIMSVQRTFSIIKPDAVTAGQAGEILAMIQKAGFKVVGLRMTRLSETQAQGFYAVHRERPFFGGLVKFMTEGPIIVMALEREDAILRLREVMGSTNPANAADGTVRKRFAANIERNCIHGSDAPETAETELRFFFSTAELI